ncbi:MAG: PH domain-containing protein [Candidatus Nomurabacteria bacterium]|jgi:uncharacterized membrane protein YdbT with pleckstrin-like domain|nr:PH domain-containing protein [Candidatus Nomurabacteria bacterium]
MNSTFPDQRPGETVQFVFRRHIFALRRGFLALIILTIIGFVPYMIVPGNRDLILIGLGAVLLGLLVLFYHWIGWYFTVYIVTDQRIRQNRQKGLFDRATVDIGLDKIQNSVVNVRGLFGSLFGYGSIALYTQAGDLVVTMVSRAEQIYGKLQLVIDAAQIGAGEKNETTVE